ncbi:MAG TPA: substrate-binding domain-containing protein [Opitutaceae bacterium]|nr:substrate-binding domain-containing protein [Opitutaceae bacterium]
MRTTLFRTFVAFVLAGLVMPAAAAPKIGVLVKARTGFAGYWGAVEKGAVEAGKKLDVDVVVKGPPSESDIGIQIQLLNALAAQGAQAIVIAPINSKALAVPIASIAVRGVKVVVIDTPITGKAAPVFVGTDQTAAGKAAGELLAKLTTDKDEVGFLRHSQASGAPQEREAAALQAFRAAHPNAPVHGDIYASAEPGTEAQKAKLLLDTYPRVKAIFASGTPGTLGMLQVIEERKLQGKYTFVGFGYNLTPKVAAAIESGAMTAWIAQLPEDMGYKGVSAAVSLLKGEAVPAQLYTDFVVVTKDNLKDPKVQALLSL